MGTLPSFRTWVSGEVVTAAYFNANVRDAGNFFVAVPIAELRQTTNQSIPSATYTALLFDSEDVDSDNAHSTVTNTSRYTAQTSGWFRFDGGCSFAANATGRRILAWFKNGSIINGNTVMLGNAGGGATTDIPARSKLIQMNGSTDYVELSAYQESGGALLTFANSSEQPHMSVFWVHS